MATSGRDPADPLGPDDPEVVREATGPSTGSPWEGGTGGSAWPGSPEDRLFSAGHRFDFFQAVRLLQRIRRDSGPVGHSANPLDEAVWFRANQTLQFPASAIQEIRRPAPGSPPLLTQNFLGLTGPSGVLPIHYSELLVQYRGVADAAAPLRDWLDLFNHRLTSFFYRAWEKYRAYPSFERGESSDLITTALLSFVGLGISPLRGRLSLAVPGQPTAPRPARLSDLTLAYYSGLLSQRPPNVAGLEQLLREIFEVDVVVDQYQGQWLRLAEAQLTRLGRGTSRNNELGVSAIAGTRAWDVQGKFRLRIGPMSLARFVDFLPLEGPSRGRTIALMFRLVRLYVGPELEFEVQLVLLKEEVPGCRLASDDPVGPRLGWNTWLADHRPERDPDDARFTDQFPTDY